MDAVYVDLTPHVPLDAGSWVFMAINYIAVIDFPPSHTLLLIVSNQNWTLESPEDGT